MSKNMKDIYMLAIELILEDGMSISIAAEMVGETHETVEKWLADYQQKQEDKLRKQEADLIDIQRRVVETQEEITIHRATYDLIMDRPDLESEKLAKKNWEIIPEKIRHKIITNAFCVDCGATIITDYIMQGNEVGITLYGKCGKCGKSMATSVEL
jgi:transposase-like protein